MSVEGVLILIAGEKPVENIPQTALARSIDLYVIM